MPKYLTLSSFRWSEREYTIKELLSSCGHQVPFLIMITQGHLGRDEGTHCISCDEVYWLHGIMTRLRLVIRDSRDRYFSIPEEYDGKVLPMTRTGKKGPAMSALQMRDSPEGYRYFFFQEKGSQYVCDGASEGDLFRMGRLELVDEYHEKFLLAYPLLQGDSKDPTVKLGHASRLCTGLLYPMHSLIPVYMPIVIAIGLGMDDASDNKFYKTVLEMKKTADSKDHNCKEQLKDLADIMAFNEKPESDYDYIRIVPINNPDGDRGYTEISTPQPVKQQVYKTPLAQRVGTVIMEKTLTPEQRLNDLQRIFHSRDIQASIEAKAKKEEQKEKEEEEEKKKQERMRLPDNGPAPPLKQRSAKSQRKELPPTPSTFALSGQINVFQKVEQPPIRPLISLGDKRQVAPHHQPVPGPIFPKESSPTITLHGQQTAGSTGRKNEEIPVFPSDKRQIVAPQLQSLPFQERAGHVPVLSTGRDNQNVHWGFSHVAPVQPSLKVLPTTAGNGERSVQPLKPLTHVTQQLPHKQDKQEVSLVSDSITSIKQIPDNISSLSVKQLGECLHVLKIKQKVISKLQDELVDGELLIALNEELLAEEFDCNTFEARKLMNFVNGWRPKIQ